jgi:hypothetical protein
LTFSGDPIWGIAAFVVSSFGYVRGVCCIIDTDHATEHLTVTINTSGFLEVRRGGVAGTILATGTTPLTANTWYYIELKANIHDSTGSYTLLLDGATELTASGVDTRNSGNGVAGGIKEGFGSGADYWLDDWYVCDTSGSLNNDFLGGVKIECVLPQTDAVAAGSNAGLTPSTGTDHGALVDETDANGDTDHNFSSTVGAKDTYNFPALALTGAVKCTHLRLFCRKTDTGDRQLTPVTRSAGTDYDGTPQVLTSVHGYTVREIRETDPATGVAWLVSGINSAEFGAKIAGA